MKFERILKKLKQGEKVTREKWEKPDCTIDFIVYDQDKGKFLLFYNGNCYSFVFNDEDIVAEDWKIYEESNLWKPKNNEEFYYLCSDNNGIYSKTNGYSYNDKCKIDIGNCFKTKKEAQHMIQKIHIITQLRKLSNINFNDTPDGTHYAIAYDVEANEITFNVSYYYKDLPFNIYFATEEDCKKAVETIGEDNLKKYYFDIKDNQ